jgi:hypothetical protein
MGHPQIAKQMLAHFPGKTNKQIRDKRNERTYKNLLKAQEAKENSTNTNATNSIRKEDNKSPDTDPPKTTPEKHEPNLDITKDPPEPNERPTLTEGVRHELDIHWISEIINQTLSESPQSVTDSKEHKMFLEYISDILRQIRATGELPSQRHH